MLLLSCPVFSQTDIKKDADKLFENEDYTKAYKFYSQLVANYPKDPGYNFRLGVCMIFSEPDKKKSLPYLLFAKRNPGDETKDAGFWLGKAYHINYLFDEAIKNYDEYKRTAPSSKLKKLQVDREIKACINGKKLLSNLTDLVVTSKKELNEADYFRSYDLKDIGGKLLAKPDDFKSGSDKKKKDASIVFLPKNSNRVYYSSYGDSPENGRDIYYSVKLANGTFSKGEKVKGINTEFDEDYPFLHPNGQTLYFASKGHNSMGGYDIFKSTYIEASDSWSTPVNLEFPINSPDDDYLFVTDSLEKTAYFSTGRQSPPGKIDVLKINTERKPIDILAMKGTVAKGTEEQGFKSVISIKNMADESAVGTYTASDDGNYTLELPNGSRLMFTVATPGMKTQSEEVELPLVTISKPFRQIIGYQDGILKITNYFNEEPTEENYLQYLKVIEKKAKLDVNEGENKLGPATSTPSIASAEPGKKNPTSSSSTPQLTDASEPLATASTTSATKGLDNKQLAGIAKQDALELQQEVTQLKQDSKDALEVGGKQKESAEQKLISANEQLKNAEGIQNEDEKKSAIEKANLLKQEAEQENALATKILAFGKSMEEDAALKQKEAQLNDSYSKELEKSINSKDNSVTTQQKLDDLQKQISALSEQKNKSEDIFNTIKTGIEEKEKQLAGLEQKKSDINLNLTEIKTSIAENEADLAKTKKKKDKEIILNQNNELKAEQLEKENQIAANDTEIKKINEELDALKNELGLANKIKTETIAPVETNSAAIVANTATATGKSAKQPTQQLASAKKTEKTKATTAKTPSVTKNQDKLSYAPLTASTSTEAVVKLDNLDKQLAATTDREIFDFNGYQNPQAQNLKIEADAKINEAAIQQKTVKETILSSREAITAIPTSGQPAVTQAQLTKEADDMVIKAQTLRTESEKKEGDEKEKLLIDARQLELKADEKYIAASDITKNDNKAIFEANSGNIQDLLAANKSTEFDLANARKLNDEAALSFKQAVNIREEANSLASAGAKLGSLSNAEEIEAEAIIKQKQAIDILKKSNPDFVLTAPVTSNSQPVASADPTAINNGLEKVNAAVTDLANTKIQSYQKLYDANAAEIDQVSASIAGNQGTLDKTPGLKNEFSASAAKLQLVKTLKQKSDDATVPDEKLSSLTDAIKKQLEVIKQLNKVNTSLNKIVESNAAVAQQKTTSPVKTAEPPAVSESTAKTESTPAPTAVNNTIEEKITPPANLDVVDIGVLSKADTTSGQLASYFDKNTVALKNTQAETTVKKSLADLKASSNEIAVLDEKIKNYQPGETTAENPAELKSKSDNLLVEAETLSGRAFAARNEATNKNGEEKDTLTARSETLENLSQAKKLEAAALTLQANDLDYKTNSAAITELLEKLKTDNPGLAADLLTKNNESKISYDQTKQLRNEANSLENIPARLGAISNVEEKEAETNQKQVMLLAELKKIYPDYVVKGNVAETPESMEAKKNQLLEKQYAGLTDLTNSFSLEYEAAKNTVPGNLTEEQNRVKQNADELNSESKRLLVQASQQNNSAEKIKLLGLSAKTGNAAVSQLSKLIPVEKVAVSKKQSGDAALKAIGKTIAANNTTAKKTATAPVPKTANTVNNSRGAVRVEGLEVLKGNAYTASRPIPIDSKMEDGLVFRVQIGAFKTRLPDNAFRGLSPLNGETTNSGYIRYTAGNFNKIENANAVKNDLRGLGYSDAFVVVYYNGKRISLNEALEIMSREGKTIDTNAPVSAGITANSNIPKATAPALNPNLNTEDKVTVTNELEKLNGLLYTVQIGVYTKQTTNNQVLNLKPIFTERLPNGLYRYTAGIYSSAERLIADKNKVILFGVKDAFVSAYINGKRVPFSEAKQRQAEDSTIKMESENPIVFPDGSTIAAPVVANTVAATIATTVQPFKNSVSAYPAATDENGIKPTEEGITFKVQIGAYSRQVPDDIAAKFSEIKTWPVENKQINDLFIYNIGSFSEPKFAKALKDEVIKLGINDAFITVYRDGVKLYGTEAASLLAR